MSMIAGSRINNVPNYLAHLRPNQRFRIAAASDARKLSKTGFEGTPADGDTILPKTIGPVTRFNAHGSFNIRKDLPKESRYIRTIRWRWKEFRGRHHFVEREGFKDIYKDCYVREPISAPGIEVTYLSESNQLISPWFENTVDQHSVIKHTINIFLELYGNCELLGPDMVPTHIPIRKVNWRILPPGEYPWDRLSEHLSRHLRGKSDGTKAVILDRQQTIYALNPTEISVGLGGFHDYMAYIFTPQRMVVLESIQKDNALYVFGQDWQHFAQMTKAEIIRGDLYRARIIHSTGWKDRLRQQFR